MNTIRKRLPWIIVCVLVILAVVYIALHSGNQQQGWRQEARDLVTMPDGLKPAVSPEGELPDDGDFELIAESSALRLYADKHTAHFIVEDKRDGRKVYSYPNPADWPQEAIAGAWRQHLRSPLILETVDLTVQAAKPEVKVNSVLSLNGGIADWRGIDGGFAVTFALPTINMIIPIEVRLGDDYVETKVIDEGLLEGKDSLLNLKLYPFFGAAQPGEKDGYLLLPDGSGAIHRIKENVSNDRSIYREPIYGSDIAFNTEYTNRKQVTMPLYGIQSAGKAVLAVAGQGAEYGYIYAAPSGVYSRYAWAAMEHNYRLQYYQPTSRDQMAGFLTFSKIRFGGDRTVRYYVLPEQQSGYSDMAAVYRRHLMAEHGLQRLSASGEPLPLYIDLIGGDVEKGFLHQRYIPGTTTDEAKQIVDRLHGQGIPRLVVTYKGWQAKGASTLGFAVATDKRLGGNEGMRNFAAYARSLGDTVLLEIDYTLNNDGRSFNPKRQGMQDQAGTVLTFYNYMLDNKVTLASPLVTLEKLKSALDDFAALGVDGLKLDGIGQLLYSDYNPRYRASRTEAASIQNEVLAATRSKLPVAAVTLGNAYTLAHTNVIRSLPHDYSYDLFMDEAVPFAPMALHGLVPYTLNWGNTRDEYRKDFLRAIEYGAAPAFVVMNAETDAMKRASSIWQYSLNYADWEATIAEEYRRFQEAVGDVQDQWMIRHRTVSPNVKETTYEQGKRIVVNYNTFPVIVEGRLIPGHDYAVMEGGELQ